MGKLHEVLAVDAATKAAAEAAQAEAIATFRQRSGSFIRRSVSYKPFADENADPEVMQLAVQARSDLADKQQDMVETVRNRLTLTMTAMAKAWDASLQIASANTMAKGDVYLDDTLVAEGLPATFLLEMEKRLARLREVCLSVPTMDPAMGYKPDEDQGAGIYKARPEERVRTKKTMTNHVVAEATEEHPAQVQLINEDVPVGTIITQVWSSMLTPAEKRAMVKRADDLLAAVKKARMRANEHEAPDVQVGEVFMKYVLDDEIE